MKNRFALLLIGIFSLTAFFMKATNGGVTLKFISKNADQGYIWTSTATSVSPEKLNQSDFRLPEYFTLR